LADIGTGAKWAVILLIAPLMVAGFYPQLILKMVGTALPR
jgi:NADH:ubiquinone oxidoreductase subunit 4 (subunit M)